MQNKNKQVNILIATLLFAIAMIMVTGAYQRPWQSGGPFYEPKPEIKVQSATSTPKTAPARPQTAINSQIGVASWYDYSLNGIEWSKTHRTCASRDLKRYTMARVTNIETGAAVDCFVNDYIEHPERNIDLSSYAFKQIAPLRQGLIKVKIEQL